MKIIKLFFILTVTFLNAGYAQTFTPQVINTTGGGIQKQGYIFNWSIGELSLVNEMNSDDGSYLFTNGFIQPEVFTAAVYNTTTVYSFSNIKIFPNPTTDLLIVNFSKNITGKLNLQLSDNAGHIMYTRNISSYKFGFVERINMKSFPKGSYNLQIKSLNTDSGQFNIESGSYKIIKL